MHPSIRPYLEYFSLPKGYGPAGLRWSANGEALETDEGTHRFARQVADFLDGFATVRPVPHFAHVLECLGLLGVRPPAACPDPERFKVVAATFRQLGGPMRNAGALFAHLGATVPPAVHVPPGGGKSLAHWLAHSPSLGFLHPAGPGNPEIPGLAAHAFHERLATRLRAMTDFEVRHWLRHGVGPQDLPAETLAEEIARKPPTLGEFLDDAVRERVRLRGAVPLVRQFVGALALPPRRRTPPKLPVGGYADVANRGDPARLLPSQLALDPDEFVRRFAENELLFFRREDPHERRREHLALVVDQGVLTWGPVRLGLGAAVLAFGRLAAKRGQTFSIRFGSIPTDRFTPPAGDPQRFGEALEASDLASHPGHALAEEVLDPSAPDRDIILLTHPRVLREPEVGRLSKVLAKGCRMFALAATEEGQVELAELREGGTVSVRAFRVDFTLPVEKPAVREVPPQTPWSGDVEPIPYPFRFGLTNRIIGLAFDAAGDRLMAATVNGFLHVWTLADGTVEVLPRGGHNGQVLKDVQAVMGVENGFVVGGRMGADLVAVHYDWPSRTVALHAVLIEAERPSGLWHAFAGLHAVVVTAGGCFHGLDLRTGRTLSATDGPMSADAGAVVNAMVKAALASASPFPNVPVIRVGDTRPGSGPYVVIDGVLGKVRVELASGAPVAFTPTADGRPRLKGVAVTGAQMAGDTLALAMGTRSPVWSLHDLGNDGRTLAEYPPSRSWVKTATLSMDGRLFARQTGRCELTVTDPWANRVVLTTAPGRCHSNLDVRLGSAHLGLSIGQHAALLDWSAGPLQIRRDLGPGDDFGKLAASRLYPASAAEDHGGRVAGIYRTRKRHILADCFGQVAVLRDGVPAAMFMYRRGELAAWTPDGVRFGPAELTGGPPTPDALLRLGEALRRATE